MRSAPQNGRADAGPQHALILREDPDLAEVLSPRDRLVATRLFRAPVIFVKPPRWEPPRLDPLRSYGLLVLDGLLGRRTRVGPGTATELLGAGDVLRPWEEPYLWSAVSPEIDWRVLEPTRLAVLDERITRLIGQRAELNIAFSSRLLRRVRSAQYLRAVSSLPRVEDRLLATFWYLASNWGTVTPRGVRVPFRLTQEVLGELIGARRPSVTTAMQRMRERGQLRYDAQRRYLLTRASGDEVTASANGAPA